MNDSILQKWARENRTQLLGHYYLKEGADVIIEFDETIEPSMNTDEKGKQYANFRVVVDGSDYIWGCNTGTATFQRILKYLTSGVYILHVMRDDSGIRVEPLASAQLGGGHKW